MQANQAILALTERLGAFADTMRTNQQLMLRIAETQAALGPALQRLAKTRSEATDDVARAHLRNIELYLQRLLAESEQGRAQSTSEISQRPAGADPHHRRARRGASVRGRQVSKQGQGALPPGPPPRATPLEPFRMFRVGVGRGGSGRAAGAAGCRPSACALGRHPAAPAARPTRPSPPPPGTPRGVQGTTVPWQGVQGALGWAPNCADVRPRSFCSDNASW